jgi:hypothetical protein
VAGWSIYTVWHVLVNLRHTAKICCTTIISYFRVSCHAAFC